MAFELSVRAQNLLDQTGVQPQLILEIDGFAQIFGAVDISKLVTIGNEITIGEFIIGGVIPEPNSRAYIQTKGSTTKIKQAIDSDRKSTQSIQRINIKLVDVNGELSRIFSPGVTVDDILSRDAVFYLGFKDGAHPQDSIKVLNGVISKAKSSAGFWDLTISHSDFLKDQELFTEFTSKLSSSITNSDTIAPLTTSTDDFIFEVASPLIESYIKIDDEIIRVETVNPTELGALTRAQFGTVAAAHDADAEVSSLYRIQGNAIDLALQLLLSGGDLSKEFIPVSKIGVRSNGTVDLSVISFSGVDIITRYNLSPGDRMTVTGSIEPLNNRIETISDIIVDGVNSDVYFAAPFIEDITDNIQASPLSQYYVSSFGCGLKTSQVDVLRFQEIAQIFSGTFFDYDFLIDEGINARDFIDEEILFPSRMFSIPRKGAVSVGIIDLALATSATPTIGFNEVINPDKVSISRSVTENFYNSVIYKYGYDVIEDKFLTVVITQNEDSQNRIAAGNKPLIIESKGMIDSVETRNLIATNTRRILDRFKFAAESIESVGVSYKTGFAVEVGDVVIFGDEQLQITDLTQGSRRFIPRLMEVVNKDFDIIKSTVSLDLLDTKFGLDGRFGVISPSSFIASGSTTTSFKIRAMASSRPGVPERNKWADYFGLPIFIHNTDFSSSEVGTLIGFDPSNADRLIVSGFTLTPLDGWTLECADYDSAKVFDRVNLWHNLHTFMQPQLEVSSVTGPTEFDVSVPDSAKIFAGSIINIHDEDYTVSGEATVDSVIGQTVTLVASAGFTPIIGQQVDLIGFSDALAPYRYF